MLVSGLEIACINSENNCNLTGPAQAVEQFKNKIKAQNIEYKEINTIIAYHSSYVKEIGLQIVPLKHSYFIKYNLIFKLRRH